MFYIFMIKNSPLILRFLELNKVSVLIVELGCMENWFLTVYNIPKTAWSQNDKEIVKLYA